MTSRLAVGKPAPSVNADVARLECLLSQQLQPLVQLDVLKSSVADKTQALHLALRLEDDNVELVQLLLKSGASAKQKLGPNSETALHVAAKHCTNPIVLKHILDADVNLNATTRAEKLTALHIAVERNDRLAVEELLSRGVRIDVQNRVGDTALHMAVKLVSEDVARLLLDHGADPNCQNDVEETPFTCSLGRPGVRLSRLMLSETAVKPVNARLKNHAGETALHFAALRCGSMVVFKSLLKLSCSNVTSDSALLFNAVQNPNSTTRMKLFRLLLKTGGTDPRKLVNKHGESLLYLAVHLGAKDVAAYLLRSEKLDVDGKPGQKFPLFSALRFGDEATANLLLRHDARTDLVDRQFCNQSSLHAAIVGFADKEALFRVCESLLDRGAPLDHFDADKHTALVMALHCDNERLADLLIARGANVCLKSPGGWSPLHIAAKKGLTDIMKRLLVAGANANDVTGTGESVLEFATYSDSHEAVKLLLEHGADCRTDGGALVSAATTHNANLEILRLLLSQGADVNLKVRGKLPLAHSINIIGPSPKNSGYVKGLLLKHTALLASQGLPVHQENLELINRYEKFKEFYEKCVRELEIMRSTRPCQEYPVSCFDLMTKRHDSLVRCLLCQKLRLVLKTLSAENPKLEIYFNDMRSNYWVGLRRLSMLQKLQELLQDVLGNKLPCELIEMLCRYFNDKELEAYCLKCT